MLYVGFFFFSLRGPPPSSTLFPYTTLFRSTFTLETWFRRDGVGIATFSGTGGVTAIPLVTKGMAETEGDRKSTRLNSSHVAISYAVFCLKKKKHKESVEVPRHYD